MATAERSAILWRLAASNAALKLKADINHRLLQMLQDHAWRRDGCPDDSGRRDLRHMAVIRRWVRL